MPNESDDEKPRTKAAGTDARAPDEEAPRESEAEGPTENPSGPFTDLKPQRENAEAGRGPTGLLSDLESEAATPADELKAAFGHLRSAAGIFLDRIKGDETLKKAAQNAEGAVTRAATGAERALGTVASETERALKKFGERAEPLAKTVAKEIGDEFDRVAKSVSSVFEADPIPREGDASEPSQGAAKENADAEPIGDGSSGEKAGDVKTRDDAEGTPKP